MAALVRGDYAAQIAAASGGALLSFTRAGADILRPGGAAAVAADPRNAACYPCAPYFGRIFGGLERAGRVHPLAPTLLACDSVHALHGEAWVAPWRIERLDEASVDLGFDHTPSPGRFPFPFRATEYFRIERDGLSIALTLENAGAEPMPAGLALHPFLPRSAGTRLRFRARRLWTPSPEGGGVERAIAGEFDFARNAPLPERGIDHTYCGFGGSVVIEEGGAATLRLETNAPFLHVYAPQGADFFCLEPTTHRPGAFGTDRLAARARMRIVLRIIA